MRTCAEEGLFIALCGQARKEYVRDGAAHEQDMKSNPIPKLQSRENMERNALRLLCSVLVKPGTRLEICRLVQPGVFLDPLRKTVFEEIQAAGLLSSRQLRAALPARVISRGFPGFDLDKLLAPKLASEAEIEQLFECTLCLLKLDGANDPFLFAPEADVQD
ncbi:MAG: hypothetical protein WB627_02610 [Candidatus Acidiferrum sp.]